jgi:hypothetical protein
LASLFQNGRHAVGNLRATKNPLRPRKTGHAPDAVSANIEGKAGAAKNFLARFVAKLDRADTENSPQKLIEIFMIFSSARGLTRRFERLC